LLPLITFENPCLPGRRDLSFTSGGSQTNPTTWKTGTNAAQ
jgi:hypothetical protein